MKLAFNEALKARRKGEVPVGAVVVNGQGQVIAKAHNLKESLPTPIGHAEILALHRAAKSQQAWRLEDCTLYVTLEPCPMCAGALVQSRIGKVVYAVADAKGGGQSLFQILNSSQLNHQIQVEAGLMEKECQELLVNFFKEQREEKKALRQQGTSRYRSSAIVVHDNKLLVFKGKDPLSEKEYLFLPGGKVETGESPAQSAERECQEETGYKIKVHPQTRLEKHYRFFWNGEDYNCTTDFFLGSLQEKWRPPQKVQDASYHQGVMWIDLKEVPQAFSYHPTILAAVQKLLKKRRFLKD